MTAPESAGRKGQTFFTRPVLFLAAVYFLPTLLPSLFGWLLGVLAVPVAYILTVEDKKQGTITLRNGFLIAGIGALVAGRLELLLFALTLLPLGYHLHGCRSTNRSEAKSGAYGILTVAVTWFFFWSLYGMFMGIQPYQHLLEMLDAGFAQTYEMYRTNSELPVEVQENLASVIIEIRSLIPRILPGILCCTVLITVWMNQVVWNSLLLRHHPDKAPWPPYSNWKLPDQLIWIPITASVLFLLGTGTLRNIGLNLIIISGLIYFFQGLAVFIHLLVRWNVPAYLRVLLYFMLVIQSYGLVLVTLLGISDIWFNFRKSEDKATPN